jgi:hypothetical protein
MPGNFAISLVRRPAEVGRPRPCLSPAALHDRAVLSKTPNERTVASEAGTIRRIPVKSAKLENPFV